ncbi:MAG: hypothetical protein KDB00_23435 [Planctomycetales bacterium]|nr:hypothetical protein [Planctomycetales bacterium]
MAGIATAQRGGPGGFGGPGGPGGFGGPGGPGGFGGPPPNPLVEAIDANADGEITLAELAEANAILAKLDRNKDGKLTGEELRPSFGGGRGFGGPDHDHEHGPEGGAAVESPLAAWMTLDKNNDGKLTKSEVGQRMQSLIARADTDKDGVATREELAKLAAAEAPEPGRGPGRGGEGRGPEGRGPEGRRPEGRGPEGRDGFGMRGGPEGREGEGRGGFGMRGGPPSPEEFVARAMSFDANQDGQLDKNELSKMAAETMGPGGRGGPRGFGALGGERPRGPGRPE